MGDGRLVSRRRDLSSPNVSRPLQGFPLRNSLACATKATNADKISLRAAKLIPVVNYGSSNDKYKVEGNPHVPLDEGRSLCKGQSTSTIIRRSPLSTLCALPLLFLDHASMGISFPSASIGIKLPGYPVLARIPGSPTYYAPHVDSNWFFYDGMYWTYEGDNWYAGSWYNGPWRLVPPDAVPVYGLRVPVHYYRQRPAYFHGWKLSAPPRWGEQWGNEWVQRHGGWDHWNRNPAPTPAPLPAYQRKYSRERYPQAAQQQVLQQQHYRYQARDPLVRQQPQAPRGQTRTSGSICSSTVSDLHAADRNDRRSGWHPATRESGK